MLVEALPRPGETIAAKLTLQSPGGKGANQAIAAARAGAKVKMIGAVGNDSAGRELRAHIASAGVDVSAIVTIRDVPTGAAFIAVAADGENHIVIAANANARVALGPHGTELAGCTVALAQLEVPIEAIGDFFGQAGALGALRILNTAPALPAARALFDQADILIFNQVELESYLALDGGTAKGEGPLAARGLLGRPGQIAIVTLGAGGAAMVAQDAFVVVAAHQVPVVDTTGAGDAFCGTLAAMAAMAVENRDWAAILDRANGAAAACVQRHGAT